MPSTTRRRLLHSLAAGSVAALAGCSGTDEATSDRWPQFGYDAANTAFAPEARGPEEEPSPEWVHAAGAYYYNSTQVLVDGAVFANAGYEGLYALDLGDGGVRWHDPADYKPLTPALADGVVLPGRFGFRSVAETGGVAVAGRRLGYRNWETDSLDYPQSPPTVSDGLLIAGVGTEGHSPDGGRIVAVDTEGGSVRWQTEVTSTVWGAPAVGDGLVFAAQRATQNPEADAALYALALDTGQVRWRRMLPADPTFDPVDAPVVGDGLVYLSSGTGPLVAYDTNSGDPVWRLDPPSGVQGSPALAEGTLYVGDLDGTFHALDAATGETRWTASVEKFYGGPAVDRDGVYAVSFEGTLVSWHPDGSERWRVSLDPPVHGTPVVADGRLYLATTAGLLYCLG
jgi:outer membrane protein assembly factor BamB